MHHRLGWGLLAVVALAAGCTPNGPLVSSASRSPSPAASAPATPSPSPIPSPSPVPIPIESGVWQTASAMSLGRADYAAVLLPSGKVLLIGGQVSPTDDTASVDVYDPITNTLTSAAPMHAARNGHTATLLPNGKVLVAGGTASPSIWSPLASTEIYDPAANTWSAATPMSQGRTHHAVLLMRNGKVLVAGGGGGTEVYDAATDTWTAVQTIYAGRTLGPVAVQLADGRVLIYGGMAVIQPGNQYELYDPNTGKSSYGTTIPETRDFAGAALLPDGAVLIVGGRSGDQPGPLNTTLVFSPAGAGSANDAWTAGAAMDVGHCHHTMTTLKSGHLLVVGGASCGATAPNRVAEIYDSVANKWTTIGSLGIPRGFHVAVLLADGRVLVAGGITSTGVTPSMEIYTAV